MKTGFNWPLDSNKIRRGSDSNTFGMVRKNADGSPRAHQGWDFFGEEETDVFSCAAGKVVYAGEKSGYGFMVVIAHEPELFTAYAHLPRIEVNVGDFVKLGQKIGDIGRTGNAASMNGADVHLHFEVRTVAMPGLGLGGRFSPMGIFGLCPMKEAVLRSEK